MASPLDIFARFQPKEYVEGTIKAISREDFTFKPIEELLEDHQEDEVAMQADTKCSKRDQISLQQASYLTNF